MYRYLHACIYAYIHGYEGSRKKFTCIDIYMHVYMLIYMDMKVAGKNIIQIGEYIMMWSRR